MEVGWISYAPVKGMRLQSLERTALTKLGIPGDREFLVVNAEGRMVNGKGAGPMMSIVPEHDREAGTLALTFPGGEVVRQEIELADAEEVAFFGLTLDAQSLVGPLGEALSDHMGEEVRLFAAPANRPGMDRGVEGAATLLSYASLERLREVAGVEDDVDPRRFRMNFGIEGASAHQEDDWVEGGRVRVGGALMQVNAHVGRCSITTRDPETGVVDFKTLHHIGAYRKGIPSHEPLPFGVYGRVLEEGEVAVGDAVEPVGRSELVEL